MWQQDTYSKVFQWVLDSLQWRETDILNLIGCLTHSYSLFPCKVAKIFQSPAFQWSQFNFFSLTSESEASALSTKGSLWPSDTQVGHAQFPQNIPSSSNKSLANYCIMLIAVVVCFRSCSWPLCSMPRSVCPKRQADCRSAPAAGLMATAHHRILLNRCLPSPLLHRWSVIWRLVLIQKNMFWIKEASRKWNFHPFQLPANRNSLLSFSSLLLTPRELCIHLPQNGVQRRALLHHTRSSPQSHTVHF